MNDQNEQNKASKNLRMRRTWFRMSLVEKLCPGLTGDEFFEFIPEVRLGATSKHEARRAHCG